MEITVVCVPFNGDVARWGCAQGPRAYLDAGLLERLRAGGHRVREPVWIDLPRSERTRDTVTNLGKIAERMAAAVAPGLREPDSFVLVLEGDCTHAVGAIGGVAGAVGTPGVVWIDAHGDINTRATSETGLWGGMPYAVALGWDLDDWREAAGLEPAVPSAAAALLGTSDLDSAEVEAIKRHDIAHLEARAMQQGRVAEKVVDLLAPRASQVPGWYVHLDVDVAGPEEVPGGLTPAPYYPSREQLLEAVAAIPQSVNVRAMGVAAYNPNGDPERRGARFGVEMACTLIERVGAGST
ncbi:MAG TPA: arginase family protein [Chloroflexota bacterium]|nr:arginase family protein [Chloroflexota bacterium]